MKHTPGKDPIEGVIHKVQVLGIAHGQIGGQTEGGQPAAGVLHRALGQVDAPEGRAGLGEALMIRAQADADLQHTQPLGLIESAEVRNVGFQRIARLGLGAVAVPILFRQVELLATGGPIPEIVHPLFVWVHPASNPLNRCSVGRSR